MAYCLQSFFILSLFWLTLSIKPDYTSNDYYKILGVSETANTEEIYYAYDELFANRQTNK